MKRTLLLLALLPMFANATVQPSYQMVCYAPNQAPTKQYIAVYSTRSYGFDYTRMDGLKVYSTLQCEIIEIKKQNQE